MIQSTTSIIQSTAWPYCCLIAAFWTQPVDMFSQSARTCRHDLSSRLVPHPVDCMGCCYFLRPHGLLHLTRCFPHGLLHLRRAVAAWNAAARCMEGMEWTEGMDSWPGWMFSTLLHLLINSPPFCIVFAWFPPFLIIQLKNTKWWKYTIIYKISN